MVGHSFLNVGETQPSNRCLGAKINGEETEKAREIKRQEIEEEKRKGNYKTKHSTLAQLVVAPSC